MGGKKERSDGLGRALLRNRKQMVQQSTEKCHNLRLQHRKVLESVTDISDIDVVFEHAEEAELLYSAENPMPTLLLDIDGSGMAVKEEAAEGGGGIAWEQSPGQKLSIQWEEQLPLKSSNVSDPDTKIYGRDELPARLQVEAELIVSTRKVKREKETHGSPPDSSLVLPTSKHVAVGFVGYPNVGKSSTINPLVGGKRSGVTSTPGKTKHFQTLIISDALILCDCPGLVFPSFNSRCEMIVSGVLPVDRTTEHRVAVQVVANKVPRHIFESIYNIKLPKPKTYEQQPRPPTAAELLRAYCASRGHVSSSGLPDETRAACQILKDYIDGRIPHFELPPGRAAGKDLEEADTAGLDDATDESDASKTDEEPSSISDSACSREPNLHHVLDDLDSFELETTLVSNKSTAATKKKLHGLEDKNLKKPQRKKDRSWRVGNDNGDGMPVVRIF